MLRYVFGALGLLGGVSLGVLSLQVLTGPPVSTFGPAVSDATGITGDAAVAALVGTVTLTPWPAVTLAASVLLVLAGAFVLVTARRWTRGGRKYEAAPATHAPSDPSRPLDAIDSWDDLSRGDDPTTGGGAR